MEPRAITKLLALCIAFLLGLMVTVNTLSPAPTFERQEGRVTRYYHNNPNPSDAGKPLAQAAAVLLAIYASVFDGLGFLVYQLLNIIIYLVVWPGLMICLTYWALGPLRRKGV